MVALAGVFRKTPFKNGKMTADLAIRVLSGERPDDIPIVHNSNLRAIVDWRALQRWHIPESALPPVQHRPVPANQLSLGARQEVFPCRHRNHICADVADSGDVLASRPAAGASKIKLAPHQRSSPHGRGGRPISRLGYRHPNRSQSMVRRSANHVRDFRGQQRWSRRRLP